MYLTTYLDLLDTAERTMSESYRVVATGHHADAAVHFTCRRFAADCAGHADALRSVLTRYERVREPAPERLHPAGLTTVRGGPGGTLTRPAGPLPARQPCGHHLDPDPPGRAGLP